VGRHDNPSGAVALVATEVADAGRYWDEDPEEMRVAMTRLRDVVGHVIDEGGGHVVTSMNEGDRTIAVFREVSAAATAALALHDRVAEEHFPPGISVRLRAAIVVGEVTLVDGVYTGAVVDQVVQLRSKAAPGTTVTSESTAELLVGLVGADASIVPLGDAGRRGDDAAEAPTAGPHVFALTRPGAERTARLRSTPSPEIAPPLMARSVGRPRPAAVIDALQHPSTLVSLIVTGLSLIYLAVLSSDLGMSALATITLALGTIATVASFAHRYSIGYSGWRDEVAAQLQQMDHEADAREIARERADTRERLEYGYGRLGSQHGREGSDVLYGLADEFDAIADLLRRSHSRASLSESALLPDLADETYRYGMSALSDALELLEFAEGPQQQRLVTELADVEERLALDEYSDMRARERDEQRLASHQQLLAHHADTCERACDLMFEAERCTAALADTRIELSSVRAGETRLDVDAVVQTLQETIRRVRDVQNEMRRMGY
jgi:class 3 adenylate cyclase